LAESNEYKVMSQTTNAAEQPVDNAKSRRHWLCFSLVAGTLLLVAGAAWVFASYSWSKSQVQAQQRAAVAAVERLGGEAVQSFNSPLPMLTFFERNNAPNIIFLNGKNVTDDDLKIFESAPTTRALHLFGNKITDDGLTHLNNLHQLEFLDLRRNPITDAGLVYLEGHKELQHLYLIGTNVTAAGVSKLQTRLPKAKIAH
jgi:hypothetical protein